MISSFTLLKQNIFLVWIIPFEVKQDQPSKRLKVCGGRGPKSPVGILEGTA